MFTKVRLKVVVLRDPRLMEQGIDIPIIRIICPVKFEYAGRQSKFYSAILDTGAPKFICGINSTEIPPSRGYCKVTITDKDEEE